MFKFLSYFIISFVVICIAFSVGAIVGGLGYLLGATGSSMLGGSEGAAHFTGAVIGIVSVVSVIMSLSIMSEEA